MALPAVPAPTDVAPTNYLYDVFFSYTHDPPFGPWAKNFFLRLFTPYLRNALARRPRVFVDESEIKPGDAWPLTVKRALGASRCLVAIMSPDYFLSEWCVKECCVMRHRQQDLGYQTIQRPGGLILPVLVFRTDHLPAAARQLSTETQRLDALRYASSVPDYERTPEFRELEIALKPWVDNVAEVINAAPPWQPDWLTPPFIDDALPPCQQELWLEDPQFTRPSLV